MWGYVRGGMGGISNALAAAARQHGAEIRCDAHVSKILVRDPAAYGVVLGDGTEIHGARVASNADAHVTFVKLMEPGRFASTILSKPSAYRLYEPVTRRSTSPCPSFPTSRRCLEASRARSIAGTIHISPTFDYIEKAYDDAKYGRPSESPILEVHHPSTVDTTVAPPGKHLMSMFVQYAADTICVTPRGTT